LGVKINISKKAENNKNKNNNNKMPYYDENGEEVSGILTPEEVEQRLAEKETEMQSRIEEIETAKQEELQSIQQQLADKEAELVGLQDKDRNFGAFRKKSEADKTEMAELKKQIDELKGAVVSQFNSINQVLSDKTIDEAVLRVSGGDKELSDKVKFFYKSFSGTPKDDKEFQARLDNALVLATGGKSNVRVDYSVGTGSTFQPNNSVGSANKMTEAQRAFAHSMGITDADIAKYDGKMPRYQGDGLPNNQWLNQ